MKCENCHKREATVKWTGAGGVLAFSHGMYKNWCEQCCLEAQIAYAKEHQNDLQTLQEKLKKIKE